MSLLKTTNAFGSNTVLNAKGIVAKKPIGINSVDTTKLARINLAVSSILKSFQIDFSHTKKKSK